MWPKIILLCKRIMFNLKYHTVCPVVNPIYIVTHYINWVNYFLDIRYFLDRRYLECGGILLLARRRALKSIWHLCLARIRSVEQVYATWNRPNCRLTQNLPASSHTQYTPFSNFRKAFRAISMLTLVMFLLLRRSDNDFIWINVDWRFVWFDI